MSRTLFSRGVPMARTDCFFAGNLIRVRVLTGHSAQDGSKTGVSLRAHVFFGRFSSPFGVRWHAQPPLQESRSRHQVLKNLK